MNDAEVAWFMYEQARLDKMEEGWFEQKRIQELPLIGMAHGAFKSYFESAFERKLPVISGSIPTSYFNSLKLIIFPGGEDVDPRRYNQQKTYSMGINTRRDTNEFSIFQTITQNYPHIKILAVCRGFQLVNVALGGTLFQDLSFDTGNDHDYEHDLQNITASSVFANIFKDRGVNSLHHQGLARVASKLQPHITGTYQGIPECFETPTMVGTQFHPEFMYNAESKIFFNKIKEWASV